MDTNNMDTNNTVNKEEEQYLNLIREILDRGTWEEGRNGRTKSIFGHSMRFSLANSKIPILTTKKTAWKTCLKELLWFIRGETDNKLLQEQGVHIWDGNSTREFLDSRGLTHYEVNELGPIYGRQWRQFNAPYITKCEQRIAEQFVGDSEDYNNHFLKNNKKGVDQLQQIIDALKDPKQRTSRRLVMTAWNPEQLDEMALPPCHILCQFNVHNGNQLSCSMYQRSVDTVLGQPFNIASYSFLTHLLAKHCGLEACEFVYFMGNCHIYEEHMEQIERQLERKSLAFPTLTIDKIRENINEYQVDDFNIENYQHHSPLKFQMIA